MNSHDISFTKMSRLHINKHIIRSLQRKHINVIPTTQITRLFCTQSSAPRIEIPASPEITKLEGVTYLNNRLLELRNHEQPSEAIIQEIRDLHQQIISMNVPDNLSVLHNKVDKLDQKVDSVVIDVKNLGGFKVDGSKVDTTSNQASTLVAPINHSHYSRNDYHENQYTDKWSFGDYVFAGIPPALCALVIGVGACDYYYQYRQPDQLNAEINAAANRGDLDRAMEAVKRVYLWGDSRIRDETIKNILTLIANRLNHQALTILRSRIQDYKLKYALGDVLEASVQKQKPDLKVVEFLIDAGALIQDERSRTWYSIFTQDNVKLVELFLDKGANVRYNSNFGIEMCAQMGHLATLQLLVKRGATVNANNNKPIILAAANGHNACVKFLYENGADPKTYNYEAIQDAARNGHRDVVETLIGYGAPYIIEAIRGKVIVLARKPYLGKASS